MLSQKRDSLIVDTIDPRVIFTELYRHSIIFLTYMIPSWSEQGPKVVAVKSNNQTKDSTCEEQDDMFNLIDFCSPQRRNAQDESLTIVKNNESKKKVNFVNKVSVILIPQRIEFVNAGLGEELWWNSSDYQTFKKIAVNEITEYARVKSVDILTAVNDLYHTIDRI